MNFPDLQTASSHTVDPGLVDNVFNRCADHSTPGDLLGLTADRGYDAKAFRDELRENGVCPLIKHRIFTLLDHAHNAHIDNDRYNQRTMETVFSSIKRTLLVALPRLRELGGWSSAR